METRFVRDRFTWLAYLMLGYFAYIQSTEGPLMPFLGDELDISYTLRGFHFSAFALGMILGGLSADRLVARFGRYHTFWGGAAGMALGAFVLILGRHPAITIGGSLLMGWAGDYTLVLIQSMLADHHGLFRAIALTESNVTASIASTIAPLMVGGLQGVGMGWRAALIVGGLYGLLLFALLGKVKVPTSKAPRASKTQSREKLPLIFWVFWLVIFMGVSIEWSIIFWGADFLDKVVGLSKENAATLMSVFFVAMVIGRGMGSRLARHFPVGKLLILAFGLSLVGFFPFWLAPVSILNILGLFVAGLGISNMFPLSLTTALNNVPMSVSDRASGRVTFGSGFAIFLAPQVLGSLADQVGISNAFAVTGMLLIAAMGVVVWANQMMKASDATNGRNLPQA
jgi:fucose permease